MNKLIKKQEEEFNEIIGDIPEMISQYKDKVCVMCGQPFDKSKQVEELKNFISKVRKETAEYVIQEMILPNVNTDDKEWEAVDRYRREQIKMKEELLLIIKIKL